MSIAALFAIDPARSRHWLFPEPAEIIYGGIAVIIIVGALVKFGGPIVKKAMAARTERIQAELDASAAARQAAEAEATEIRRALGDIESERARLIGDAEAQAAVVLAEGRARLEQEVIEMQERAVADAEVARGRGIDELRGEIVLAATAAIHQIVSETLDDATQQQLVEEFISRVGAQAGAGS